MESCSHEVHFNGLCALCGKRLDESLGPTDAINMTHGVGVTVSQKEAERIENESKRRLLQQRKLSLVIDLDQTIIHAVDKFGPNQLQTSDELRCFFLYNNPYTYYIKLRPGLVHFLREASKLYEMHVYTMGTRSYADAVAREIDPDRTLFRERILSRDENGDDERKFVKRLFPYNSSMVVVLDDRPYVWDFSPNLIPVKQYEYFTGVGDINAPARTMIPPVPIPKSIPDTSAALKEKKAESDISDESGENKPESSEVVDAISDDKNTQSVPASDNPQSVPSDENDTENHSDITDQHSATQTQQLEPTIHHIQLPVDNDNELYKILELLRDIHKQYYTAIDQHQTQPKDGAGSPIEDAEPLVPDVAEIMSRMRRQVLQGTSIVFSGIMGPQFHFLWRLADFFGASCSMTLTEKTTHLIAERPGTEKFMKALRYGSNIHIVSRAWLVDSTTAWERMNEKAYRLARSVQPPESVGDVDNPESTPLDLEDGAFDDPVQFTNLDWDEVGKEVDDFLQESGTEMGDTDSEAFESEQPGTLLGKKRIRQRDDNDEHELTSDEDDHINSDEDENEKDRSKRRRRLGIFSKIGPSSLSQVTSADTSDVSDDEAKEEFPSEFDGQRERDDGYDDDDDDNDNDGDDDDDDDDDDESLDDLAELLDAEVE